MISKDTACLDKTCVVDKNVTDSLTDFELKWRWEIFEKGDGGKKKY